MECYYHPERDGTDVCAICGKSVCKECGLEIAGKIYCKDCLEKIVGMGLSNASPNVKEEPVPEMKSEPARLNKQPADETIYQPQESFEPITPEHDVPYQEETSPNVQSKAIGDDSPYNIKDNINYSGGLESSYLHEPEEITPEAKPEVPQKPVPQDDGYIYPDHTYEPEPREGAYLEAKYEKYLDDLYFDENEIPLNEQLAKDEEEYGSLTKKPYKPKKSSAENEVPETLSDVAPKKGKMFSRNKNETEAEIEARIRAELANEMKANGEKSIHNLNYQQEDEKYGVVDIILTIILIIVILIVIYYLIYLFVLHASYPTFMDALYALKNPQNVVNNLLK